MTSGTEYLAYWKLAFAPFADDLRRETFIPTSSSTRTIGRLMYALADGPGAAGLYGAAGVGKTRVVRRLLDEFAAARWLVCYLPNPLATPAGLLLALDPGARRDWPDREAAMHALTEFLERRAALRLPALLAVDDVQATRNPDFLEFLRTLMNIAGAGGPALRLLLSGQPEMENRLRAASRFDSRFAARAVLEPMTGEETKLYILARLKAAESGQGIFTKNAADMVAELSGGVPRRVNLLCELALVIAFGLDRRKVDPETVEMAAADLDILPGAAAAFFPWTHPDPPEAAPPEPEPEGEDILAGLMIDV